jgi:YbbR domain-containing protein
VLENLTPEEDVIVFVILTDFVADTYRVELQYEILPDRVILEAMNPDTIEVIITEQSAPPEDQTPTPEATSSP